MTTLDDVRDRVADARAAHLSTASPDGDPHLMPVVFALVGDAVYIAIDEKPKRTLRLRRVRNIESNPRAALLVDLYDEDWSTLWWVLLRGPADAPLARPLERGRSDRCHRRPAPQVLPVCRTWRWKSAPSCASAWSASSPGPATARRSRVSPQGRCSGAALSASTSLPPLCRLRPCRHTRAKPRHTRAKPRHTRALRGYLRPPSGIRHSRLRGNDGRGGNDRARAGSDGARAGMTEAETLGIGPVVAAQAVVASRPDPSSHRPRPAADP